MEDPKTDINTDTIGEFSANSCYICGLCGAILIPPPSRNHNDHCKFLSDCEWTIRGPDPKLHIPFHHVCLSCNKKSMPKITLTFS